MTKELNVCCKCWLVDGAATPFVRPTLEEAYAKHGIELRKSDPYIHLSYSRAEPALLCGKTYEDDVLPTAANPTQFERCYLYIPANRHNSGKYKDDVHRDTVCLGCRAEAQKRCIILDTQRGRYVALGELRSQIDQLVHFSAQATQGQRENLDTYSAKPLFKLYCGRNLYYGVADNPCCQKRMYVVLGGKTRVDCADCLLKMKTENIEIVAYDGYQVVEEADSLVHALPEDMVGKNPEDVTFPCGAAYRKRSWVRPFNSESLSRDRRVTCPKCCAWTEGNSLFYNSFADRYENSVELQKYTHITDFQNHKKTESETYMFCKAPYKIGADTRLAYTWLASDKSCLYGSHASRSKTCNECCKVLEGLGWVSDEAGNWTKTKEAV